MRWSVARFGVCEPLSSREIGVCDAPAAAATSGSVVEFVANDLAPPETLGAFEFHVRPTRPSQGRLSTGEVLMDEHLPRDPRVKVRPRRGGPGRVFRVSFRARINGRLELALEHRGSGCGQESTDSLPFTRGRATLLIGDRLKPGRRPGNVWAIRPAARLCRGEWAGFGNFVGEDVLFGFTVVREHRSGVSRSPAGAER
jgi:hypothetical protein